MSGQKKTAGKKGIFARKFKFFVKNVGRENIRCNFCAKIQFLKFFRKTKYKKFYAGNERLGAVLARKFKFSPN